MIAAFEDYDIICLQECFDTFTHRQFDLIEKLEKAGFKYVNTSDKPGFCEPKMIDGGIVVMSKFPIVESNFYDYGTMGQSDGLSKKGILYCRIQIEVPEDENELRKNKEGVLMLFLINFRDKCILQMFLLLILRPIILICQKRL